MGASSDDSGDAWPAPRSNPVPDVESGAGSVRDRAGTPIIAGCQAIIVDAVVTWPGHGQRRLTGVRGEVRAVTGVGTRSPSITIRVNGVDLSVSPAHLEVVSDTASHSDPASLSALAAAFTDDNASNVLERFRNVGSQMAKAKRDTLARAWAKEWAAAEAALWVSPRPHELDHPDEPAAPVVPPGVSPRYSAPNAFDAIGAVSDLRSAAEPGRGGLANWNQRKRERENARANVNSFELQQAQQDFTEAQARYDREFAEYERDCEIYEMYLRDDPTWRTRVAMRLAEPEQQRLRVAYAIALEVRSRNPTAQRAIKRAQEDIRKRRLPAQWVDDPADGSRWRYWDGQQLTAETSPKKAADAHPLDTPVPTIKEILHEWGVDAADRKAPTTPVQGATETSSKAAQVRELFELRNVGAITEAEFEEMKRDIIDSPG